MQFPSPTPGTRTHAVPAKSAEELYMAVKNALNGTYYTYNKTDRAFYVKLRVHRPTCGVIYCYYDSKEHEYSVEIRRMGGEQVFFWPTMSRIRQEITRSGETKEETKTPMVFDDITPLSKDDQLREVDNLVQHMAAATVERYRVNIMHELCDCMRSYPDVHEQLVSRGVQDTIFDVVRNATLQEVRYVGLQCLMMLFTCPTFPVATRAAILAFYQGLDVRIASHWGKLDAMELLDLIARASA